MIKPITSYIRQNAVRCWVSKPKQLYPDFNIQERLFLDKEDVAIGHMVTYSREKGGQRFLKSVLTTLNGLFRVTEHQQNIIKLQKYKKKENFKFPYITSYFVTDSDNNLTKRSTFMIMDGVEFIKTDQEGYMIYKKVGKLKTRKLSIHTQTTDTDLTLNV